MKYINNEDKSFESKFFTRPMKNPNKAIETRNETRIKISKKSTRTPKK